MRFDRFRIIGQTLCLISALPLCGCATDTQMHKTPDVVSNPALSDWAKVNEGDEITLYVDPFKIRTDGNIVTMSHLLSLRTTSIIIGDNSYLSMKEQVEYDCKEYQSREINFSFFTGKVGSGSETDPTYYRDYEEINWKSVLPESLEALLLNLACTKHQPLYGHSLS